METMSIAMTLVGVGGLSAGVVGILLPPTHRLGAALALVAGAGVGVIVLALGVEGAAREGSARDEEQVFLLGSALGLATVLGMLAVAWRRASGETQGSGTPNG